MKSFQKIAGVSIVLCGITLVVLFFPNIIEAIRATRSFIYDVFTFSETKLLKELKHENQMLRAKLETLQHVSSSKEDTLRSAWVYSKYPFNDANRVVITKGYKDGVFEKMPVFAGEGILFGRVVHVKKIQSEVQTIFDPEWKSAVEIGPARVKGVLHGGNPPRIELIAKDSKIIHADEVRNIASEFPFRAILGEVGNIDNESNAFWKSASLAVSYNPDTLSKVYLVEFP